jgi:hypothetical protein
MGKTAGLDETLTTYLEVINQQFKEWVFRKMPATSSAMTSRWSGCD